MIISQGLMRMREYDKIEEAVKRMDWPRIAAGGTLSAVPSQHDQNFDLCTLPDCDTTNNFLHMQYKQHRSVQTLAECDEEMH